MRKVIGILSLLATVLTQSGSALAQPSADRHPLYVVNGQRWSHEAVDDIPEDNILRIETLPADEQTIARYGEEAAHGVVIIDLCYDEEARFGDGSEPFDDYVERRVKWSAHHGVQRFVVRYTVKADGTLLLGDELQSTDKQFRRRVLQVVAAAPRWEPARKAGQAVDSHHLLVVQLPKGKPLPTEPYVILR